MAHTMKIFLLLAAASMALSCANVQSGTRDQDELVTARYYAEDVPHVHRLAEELAEMRGWTVTFSDPEAGRFNEGATNLAHTSAAELEAVVRNAATHNEAERVRMRITRRNDGMTVLKIWHVDAAARLGVLPSYVESYLNDLDERLTD